MGPASTDLPPQVPLDLKPGEEHAFDLLLAKEPESAKVKVAVVVRPGGKDASVGDLFLARFNDGTPGGKGAHQAGLGDAQTLLFRIPPAVMRDGSNRIVIRNGQQPIRMVAFEVRVNQ